MVVRTKNKTNPSSFLIFGYWNCVFKAVIPLSVFRNRLRAADTSVPESFSPASVVIIIFWTDLYSKSCSHHVVLSVANKGHNYANGMLLQYKTCK